MFRNGRTNACLLVVIAVSSSFSAAHAQQTKPAPTGPTSTPPPVAGLTDVLATVTVKGQTEKITKGDVLNILTRYPLPPAEERENVYRETIDQLVKFKLLNAFLVRQRISVPPAKVDEDLARLEQQLKADGQDLATELRRNGISMNDIRTEYENRARWSEYVRSQATDAELRKFLAENRDLFSGTQVRASHILIKVDPNASEADKDKVRKKLAAIKLEIEEGKTTFAQAANKYSEDPANAQGAGGDLDYFTLNSGFIEEFTNVAFKLKKGGISDPVETAFGFHLINVTDRREGKPVDFEQNKAAITSAFAGDLQKDLVTAERKIAKIDIQPMPKDLFPSQANIVPEPRTAAPAKP